MKQVDEMPTEGQFVAVWKERGVYASMAFELKNGELFGYGVEDGYQYPCVMSFEDGTKFFIAD